MSEERNFAAVLFLQIRNPRNTDILLVLCRALRLNFRTYINKLHTVIQNHNNVLIRQLLHVSGFIFPSSGSAQLYKTIV